jgi:hypothetical protein
MNSDVTGVVDRATNSNAFEYAARAGYSISGVLHLLVAFIVLRIALGSGGSADQSGALATLASGTGGKFLLWIAAIGLLAMALWRIAETVVGKRPSERATRSGDDTDATDRLKAAALAVTYLALAYSALRFAVGSGQSNSAQNVGMSAKLMQSGWGKAALIVVGLVVIGVGGYHLYKGATKRFLKDLKTSGGSVVTPLGVGGYLAKGAVLSGAGILVIVATLTADPAKASGIDAAVKTLGQAPFGKILLLLAALGLAAYGAFCFVQARFARM